MSKAPENRSILVLTLGRGGGAGVLCSRVLRRSEPLVCFQINKRLCVISSPHLLWLNKRAQEQYCSAEGKKASWWLTRRDQRYLDRWRSQRSAAEGRPGPCRGTRSRLREGNHPFQALLSETWPWKCFQKFTNSGTSQRCRYFLYDAVILP